MVPWRAVAAVGSVHNGAKPSFRRSFDRISVWGTLTWSKWVCKLGFGPLCTVFGQISDTTAEPAPARTAERRSRGITVSAEALPKAVRYPPGRP